MDKTHFGVFEKITKKPILAPPYPNQNKQKKIDEIFFMGIRGISHSVLSGFFAGLSGFFGKVSFDPDLAKSTFENLELNVRVSKTFWPSFLLSVKHVSMAVDFISKSVFLALTSVT